MIGRGNRAFGQAKGTYYTWEFGMKKLDTAKRLNNKEPARGNCYLLVKMLYNQYANMTPKEKA